MFRLIQENYCLLHKPLFRVKSLAGKILGPLGSANAEDFCNQGKRLINWDPGGVV